MLSGVMWESNLSFRAESAERRIPDPFPSAFIRHLRRAVRKIPTGTTTLTCLVAFRDFGLLSRKINGEVLRPRPSHRMSICRNSSMLT